MIDFTYDKKKSNVMGCTFYNNILPLYDPGVVEYLSNGGVAENHKDFKELRYNECLTNFSCNGKNGNSDGSITHSFQLKSAYDSNLMPYTNYTYDFKVKRKMSVCKFYITDFLIIFQCSLYIFRLFDLFSLPLQAAIGLRWALA